MACSDFIGHFLVLSMIGLLRARASTPSLLYDAGNTTISDWNIPFRINLQSEKIPYYGRIYSSVYISRDGMIGFTQSIQYKRKRYGKAAVDPHSDEPFVAPYHFHSKCGTVYYRILLHGAGVNDELTNLGDYISKVVLGLKQFRATWGIVVTWYRMKDSPEACANDTETANTFQVVLLTNGHRSFSILYYSDMKIATNMYYQSGFNGGFGQGWTEAIPFEQLRNAPHETGGDIAGKYVFQINEKFIVRDGCVNFRHNYGTLYTYPTFAGMLGGEMLDLSGPCFQPNDKIKCKFGDDEALSETTSGFVVNAIKARCPVPRLLQNGRVQIALSIDQGKSYYYKTVINVVHPLLSTPLLTTVENEWNVQTSETMSLTWRMADLTDDKSALMDVRLIGYVENSSRGLWSVLRKLGSNLPISLESHVIKIADHPCIASDCKMFDVGFIELKLRNISQATTRRSIKSHVMPLGWFKNKAMIHMYGQDWSKSKCSAWYDKDQNDMRWRNQIADCPCTLHQALVDKAGWYPNPECNMYTKRTCSRHPGAFHCVLSMQLTFFSAGNECCYTNEGDLIYTQDTSVGSVPTRSDIWGKPPYIYKGYVPYMSYLLSDEMPYYFCCKWSKSDSCQLYRQQRITTDCTSYNPPGIATIYGQSHYRKFDGTYSRLCGLGDYVLLQTSDVTIQGRFERNVFAPKDSKYNGSVILTGLAILFKSDIVEVYIKPPTDDRSQRNLDVIVNNEYVLFPDQSVFRQDFSRFIIINLNDTENVKHSNLTIILRNGIAVDVAETDGRVFAIFYADVKHKDVLSGLLGTWNGTNSEMLEVNVSSAFKRNITEQNNSQTGDQSESIFHHAMIYDNQSITCETPVFTEADVSLCQGHGECVVDMASTRNVMLALSTKYLASRCIEINKFAQKVVSCGVLEIDNAIKDTGNYTVGSSVTVTGCTSGYLQKGGNTYTCMRSTGTVGMWSPKERIRCIPTEEVVGQITLFLGIVAGFIGLIYTCAQLASVFILNRFKVNRVVYYKENG